MPSLQPASGNPIYKVDTDENKQDKFICNAVAFTGDYPACSGKCAKKHSFTKSCAHHSMKLETACQPSGIDVQGHLSVNRNGVIYCQQLFEVNREMA
jgi:hypothetical protein